MNCRPENITDPTFKPNCCTEDSPCGLGEGACRTDATCMNNLVCGSKNCKNADNANEKTNCCTTPWDMPGLQYRG